MTPIWKNDDLEGAVIGAIFLRGADPEVLGIISRLPASAFSVRQYREIYSGICRQARGTGVIDPLLLCETMPGYEAIILESSRIAWAKSALVSYVSALERNAAVRDAELVIEKALAGIRAAANGESAVKALEAAQASMAAISLTAEAVQPVHIDDILPAVVDRVDARSQGQEEAKSLLTGIDDLDAKTGGIEPTDLVFIAARPSMGKAMPLDEKILLSDGTWTTHGKVKVGEHLASIDGQKSVVTGVFPQGKLPTYLVTFEDGRKVKCANSHLWEIRSSKFDGSRVVDTEKLASMLEKTRYRGRLCVPSVSGNFGEDKSDVDGWVLGALLGDGSLTKCIKFTNSEDYILRRIADGIFPLNLVSVGRGDYVISSPRGRRNSLLEKLREYGLMGKSACQKEIPESIFSSSREVRTGVLMGLLETDGWVEKNGCIRFSSSSKKLSDGVVKLVRSLGGVARETIRTNIRYSYKGDSRNGMDAHMVTVRLPDDILSHVESPRLRNNLGVNHLGNRGIAIKSVEIVEPEECLCIMVSHPRHLYITTNYVVTHNTELALDIIDKVSEQGHGVLFFSMEMASIQIGERMVSAAGGMSVSRLKAAERFDDEDWARLSTGVGRLTGRSIWIVDATNLTLEQIQQTSTSLQMEHPEIALVVVDYLALIRIQSTARYDLAVGEISKGLKNLAKANKTPVIALSQLSRGVESRPNKRPMNSDLKNSGEIEADADIILMLYRDEVYNPESPAKGIAEINITKQRNGVLGTVYRRFYNGHFLPVDQEEAKSKSTPQQKPRRYAKA